MIIHKEGFKILTVLLLFLLILNTGLTVLLKSTLIFVILVPISLILFILTASFFRNPKRKCFLHDNAIIAPADGKIVAIEEVEENEFIKTKCIQVSIFMNLHNVHINWFPVNGKIIESYYKPGLFMAAYLPKSSTDNERTSTLIQCNNGKQIAVNQVAGAIARRIVCYAKQNNSIKQGEQLGFIKFGSRVDLYLPSDTRIDVKLEQKVRGNQTVIGWF